MNIATPFISKSQAQYIPTLGKKIKVTDDTPQVFKEKDERFFATYHALRRHFRTGTISEVFHTLKLSYSFRHPTIMGGLPCFQVSAREIWSLSDNIIKPSTAARMMRLMVKIGILIEITRENTTGIGCRIWYHLLPDGLAQLTKNKLTYSSYNAIRESSQLGTTSSQLGTTRHLKSSQLGTIQERFEEERIQETSESASHYKEDRGANEPKNFTIPFLGTTENNLHTEENRHPLWDPNNPCITRPKLGLMDAVMAYKKGGYDGRLQEGCLITGESHRTNENISNTHEIITDSHGGSECEEENSPPTIDTGVTSKSQLSNVRGEWSDEVAGVKCGPKSSVDASPRADREDISNGMSTRKVESSRENYENSPEIPRDSQPTALPPILEKRPLYTNNPTRPGETVNVEREGRIEGRSNVGEDGTQDSCEDRLQNMRRDGVDRNNNDNFQSQSGQWEEGGICSGGSSLRAFSGSAAVSAGKSIPSTDSGWSQDLHPCRSFRAGWSKRLTRWR